MKMQTDPPIFISATQARPASKSGLSLPPLSCDIGESKMVFLMGSRQSISLSYMHILAGIEPPETGNIMLLGKNYFDSSPEEQKLLRQKVGFVMQGGPLLSVINGIENLKLAARYHQLGDEQNIQQKAELLLAEFPDEFDQKVLPAFMNKLQRRLLAIARPLMLDPQVLFLDNPFEGLGHHDKVIVGRYIANLANNKPLTLVINSDDLYFAHSHANLIIFCDYDDAMIFDNWQHFYQSKRESIALLFEQEHIKTDA